MEYSTELLYTKSGCANSLTQLFFKLLQLSQSNRFNHSSDAQADNSFPCRKELKVGGWYESERNINCIIDSWAVWQNWRQQSVFHCIYRSCVWQILHLALGSHSAYCRGGKLQFWCNSWKIHQQNVIMSLGASGSIWKLSDRNPRLVKSQSWLDRRSGLQMYLGAPESAGDKAGNADNKPGSTWERQRQACKHLESL
jgi:hypothetical protein